jgi:hypothetical protein
MEGGARDGELRGQLGHRFSREEAFTHLSAKLRLDMSTSW